MARIVTVEIDETDAGQAIGYTLTVHDVTTGATVYEYTTGNHPGISEVWISPATPGALDRETLTRYANQTAEEVSREYDAAIADE